MPAPFRPLNVAELLQRARERPPVPTPAAAASAAADKADDTKTEEPDKDATALLEVDTEEATTQEKQTGKKMKGVDPKDWLERHKDIVKNLPDEARPPPHPHGEHSYTKNVMLGRRGTVCKIEVHIRTSGFRIIKPRLKKEDGPFIPWDGNPEAAWAKAKEKCLLKLVADNLEKTE